MIYSKDIEKICRLCLYAKDAADEDYIYCEKRKKCLRKSQEACKKFSYDILKKTVRRKQKLNNNFNAEDFKL